MLALFVRAMPLTRSAQEVTFPLVIVMVEAWAASHHPTTAEPSCAGVQGVVVAPLMFETLPAV